MIFKVPSNPNHSMILCTAVTVVATVAEQQGSCTLEQKDGTNLPPMRAVSCWSVPFSYGAPASS